MSGPSLNRSGGPAVAFPDATGLGVRIAVIDSGVSPRHPHIAGVAGGISIGEECDSAEYSDFLGHGTAVMAAIQEKAPDAEYFAVRVFHTALRATADRLICAIDWATDNRMDLVNLSLGTVNMAHTERFAEAVGRAVRAGTLLVAARDAAGRPCLPGTLPGVFGVGLDAACPRNAYHCARTPHGVEYRASGFARPVPGVPPELNLNGISFAVANMSGFAARALQTLGGARTPGRVEAILLQYAV